MPNTTSHKYPNWRTIVFAELQRDGQNWFAYRLSRPTREQLIEDLGIISLSRFNLRGSIESSGKKDWLLTAQLKCRVMVECRLTLNPFPIPLNIKIVRKFISNSNLLLPNQDNSIPEDETMELLTPTFDLSNLVRETLFLEVPDYPTNKGSNFDSSFNDKEREAHETIERDNPFAVLVKGNPEIVKPT